MGVFLSTPVTDKRTEGGESKTLQYGASEMQGWRRSMEDTHLACLDIPAPPASPAGSPSGNGTVALFGVFDGHGGTEVSKFCQAHMPKELVQLDEFKAGDYAAALRRVFHRMDELLSTREGIREELEGYRRAAADSPSVASQAKKARTKRSASDGDGDAVGGDEGEDDDKPGISTSEAIEWFQKLLDFTKAEKAGGAGASIRIGRRTAGGNASIAEASAAPAASKAAVEPLKGAWAAAATAASTTAAAGSGKEDYMEVMEAAESAAAAATASAATAGEAAPATAPNTAISPDAAAIGPIIVADGGPAGGGAGEGQAGEGGRTAAAAEDDDDEASKKAAADDMRVLMGLGAPGAPTCELADHAVPSGCTAVVALLAGDELLVANAGDSRAIVCRAGVAVALSQDHKPQQEGEAARIAAAGGFVTAAGRVNGNLNLSRSIGDLKYKQNKTVPPEAQMITAEPDVTTYLLTPKDEFLVLACDGVWDCMTNDEVAAFVRERLPQMTPSQIAEAIFDRCISEDPRRTGGLGGDNMTCLICVFKPPS